MNNFIGCNVHDYEFNETAKIVDYIKEEDLYVIEFSDGVAIGRFFDEFKIIHYDILEENLNKLFPNSTNITLTEKFI